MAASGPLPFVDALSVDVDAAAPITWRLVRERAGSLGLPEGPLAAPLRLLWRPRPPRGFAVSDEQPGRWVDISGAHRFSTYRMRLEVVPLDAGRCRLVGHTWAAFPGPLGAAYRLVVVRSGLHVLATRAALRRWARAAERAVRP